MTFLPQTQIALALRRKTGWGMTLFGVLATYGFAAALFDSFVIARPWPLIGAAEFPAYHRALARQIEWFFALPLALLTLLNGLLLWNRPLAVPRGAVWLTLGCLGAVWVVSALVLIPLQRQLDARLDPALLHRLFRLDWLRIIPFTIHFGTTVILLRRSLKNA